MIVRQLFWSIGLRQPSMAVQLNSCSKWITWIGTEASDANYFFRTWITVGYNHCQGWHTRGSPRGTRATVFLT